MKKEKQESVEIQEKNQFNLTFSLSNLAIIFCIVSLGLTFIFTVLASFGVGSLVMTGIFYLLAILLSGSGLVLSLINSRNKFNFSVGFAILSVLATLIVYF